MPPPVPVAPTDPRSPSARPVEGLRARKKRRTRQAISDIATRLFFEHGFEEVTLADIAEAAEVSVKTIFNHFGGKEDLFFDRAEELRQSLVTTIVDRPPGTTVLGGLETLLVDNRVPFAGDGWDGLDHPEGFERFRAFLATQERSPALRARRLVIAEQLGDLVADVLAAELELGRDDPALRALAAMLVAALELRAEVLSVEILARTPAGEVRRRVTRAVEETFRRLTAAFGDLDVPK